MAGLVRGDAPVWVKKEKNGEGEVSKTTLSLGLVGLILTDPNI